MHSPFSLSNPQPDLHSLTSEHEVCWQVPEHCSLHASDKGKSIQLAPCFVVRQHCSAEEEGKEIAETSFAE